MTFAWEEDIILIITADHRHTSPLSQRDTVALSSEATCYTNTFEQIIQTELSMLVRYSETGETKIEFSHIVAHCFTLRPVGVNSQ